MAYSILLTSLYTRGENDQVKYYFAKDGERVRYCDAMLSGEASSKYILSKYHIDEIITIGSKTTCDDGDEERQIVLREGSSFITADMGTLSAYSLLRYRLAQYILELNIEKRDILASFGEEAQKEMISFLKTFFRKTVNRDGTKKFNRLFDGLSQDPALLGEFGAQFAEVFPEAAKNPGAYLDWIRGYLYGELKDTLKLEALEGNIDTKVRFIPTRVLEDGSLPGDNLLKVVRAVTQYGKEDVDLYIGLHGDDVTDTFVLISILNMLRGMPESRVNVRAIITTGNLPNAFVNEISDDTESFSVTDMISGMEAFIDYGKVDRLQRYWTSLRVEDAYIESVLYAMRTIDAGISLCDIGDIENGIKRLRELLRDEEEMLGKTYQSRLFSVVVAGIKRDYGPLLSGEELDFIELVKWGYRKKFYQQTLTIIESRAPQDMADRGLFSCARTEEEQERAVEKLAEEYSYLRPFERYKIEEDVPHYFVKFYRRDKVPHAGSQRSRMKGYADFRVGTIDTDDPQYLAARTSCEDREALRDLLFAYYHLGDVRNLAAHASTRDSADEDGRLIVEESDMTVRMNLITQSIEYFLRCHEKACASLPEDPLPGLALDVGEIARRGSRLRREREKDRFSGGDKDKKDKDRKKES